MCGTCVATGTRDRRRTPPACQATNCGETDTEPGNAPPQLRAIQMPVQVNMHRSWSTAAPRVTCSDRGGASALCGIGWKAGVHPLSAHQDIRFPEGRWALNGVVDCTCLLAPSAVLNSLAPFTSSARLPCPLSPESWFVCRYGTVPLSPLFTPVHAGPTR